MDFSVAVGRLPTSLVYPQKQSGEREVVGLLGCIPSLHLILNGITLQSIHLQGFEWPQNMLAITMIYFSIFCFFSGTPTFTMFFLYFTLFLGVVVTAHFVWSKPTTAKMYGSESKEIVYLDTEYLAQIISTVALGLTYLAGSYLMEIAKRKKFLQRMLMHSQQKQIIAEKTKNEALQRQLLENMLPTSIVDQLQRQNFTVSSWDQLRALSHRHFGVSIMFAELENFTAFSSEVAPAQVMEYLNDMFSIFDDLCDQHEVYKVETVGDQYVAAVGIVTGEMLTEGTLSLRRSQSVELMSTKSLNEMNNVKIDKVSIRGAACSNTAHMIEYAQAIIEGSKDVVVPPEIESCPLLRVGIHTVSICALFFALLCLYMFVYN
jgi:class 3 adenylate cyclase